MPAFNQRLIAVCMTLIGTMSSAFAEDWRYEFTPYFLGAGMSGTLGAHGVTTELDASASDILSNLNAGFMGLFTAQNGRWILGLEVDYLDLEASGSKVRNVHNGYLSLSSELQVSSSMFISQASAGYRLLDESVALDVVGALRYTDLQMDTQLVTRIEPGLVFDGGQRSASDSLGWLDAVVGVRVNYPLDPKFSLVGYADIGGGADSSTYQLLAGVNWTYAPGWTAKAGYRYLSWDYNKDGVVWDVAASGPYIGLGIGF